MIKLLNGSYHNVRFSEFQGLLKSFGFSLARISGSHHIYIHTDLRDIVNIQNVKGHVKPYQIRQVLKLIEQYNLRLEE